ncbi:hypothetical protein H4219_004399 [Mycoemilia scoparia]|uniref:Uncharacterized protein n=1 Tax=Mycoemilia scoparia TaxID=417184 RepID=A0A9W7ZXH8_9FUNG|nr:hypothetical protein H4219_004399 [Mycoemilia scoparia]
MIKSTILSSLALAIATTTTTISFMIPSVLAMPASPVNDKSAPLPSSASSDGNTVAVSHQEPSPNHYSLEELDKLGDTLDRQFYQIFGDIIDGSNQAVSPKNKPVMVNENISPSLNPPKDNNNNNNGNADGGDSIFEGDYLLDSLQILFKNQKDLDDLKSLINHEQDDLGLDLPWFGLFPEEVHVAASTDKDK